MKTGYWSRWLRRGLVAAAVLAVGIVAVDVSAGAFLRDRLDARGLGDTVTFARAQPRLSLDGATLNLADFSVGGAGAGLAAESLTIAGVDPLQPDPMGGMSLRFSHPALQLEGVPLPDWLAALGDGERVEGTLALVWIHDAEAERAVLSVDLDGQGIGRVAVELGVAGVSRAMLEAALAAAAALAGGEPPSAESLAVLMPLVSSLALTHLSLVVEDAGAVRPYLRQALGEADPDTPLARLAALAEGDGDVGTVAAAITGFLDGSTDRLALHTGQDQPVALLERRSFISWGPAPILTDPAAFIRATELEPEEG